MVSLILSTSPIASLTAEETKDALVDGSILYPAPYVVFEATDGICKKFVVVARVQHRFAQRIQLWHIIRSNSVALEMLGHLLNDDIDTRLGIPALQCIFESLRPALLQHILCDGWI